MHQNLIERYSFIPIAAWETIIDVFPNAVSYGNSKIVQYASPTESEAMHKLVDESGLELIHHTESNAQMIITAIESGIDKIHNCNHDVAIDVAKHFGGESE